MKKFLGVFMASALLLGACDTEREPPAPNTYGEADLEENQTEEAATDETETDTDSDTAEEAQAEAGTETDEDEETDTETESDMTDMEEDDEEIAELDEDIRATLDQDFEEINWDDVHLTRGEFDASLYEFQENLNEDYEEDEDVDIYIDAIDFSGDTIEVTLTNNDESEFAEMTNGFIAAFIDSFYRQLYLRSDYSNGTDHPRIIVQTSEGDVITDREDFLEFEE